MENLTNQILKLKSGKNYFVLRQAAYKGITYYFGAEVTSDEEDFTNKFVNLPNICLLCRDLPQYAFWH